MRLPNGLSTDGIYWEGLMKKHKGNKKLGLKEIKDSMYRNNMYSAHTITKKKK